MGRIRTVKPEFHTNADLSALPAEAHLLASGLLCYSDDEGYFDANPRLVQAAIFPLRDLATPITELLKMLLDCGYITVVSHNSKSVGHVVTFTTHQRVNRPTPSRLKPHGVITESSPVTHEAISNTSLPEGKGKEEEGKGEPALTPEMIAKRIQIETGIVTDRGFRVICDVVKREQGFGILPDVICSAMTDAWQSYQIAKPALEFTWGAEKFFGEANWKDQKAWPWKDGKHPASLKPKSAPAYDRTFDDMVERAKQESRANA